MRNLALAVSLLLLSAGQAAATGRVGTIRAYIASAWNTLTRSHAALGAAAIDPKLGPSEQGVVYVPADEDLPALSTRLSAEVPAKDWARLRLRRLPAEGRAPSPAGLLYLPYPYVVPGGRFNEMYGWDSYFILVGLMRDGRVELAKDMTDNFLYEVAHYGKVLNANRTYYLTRSQPPFLSEMTLAVYDRTRDRSWLAHAAPLLERYYAYWTTGPHAIPGLGLSRYYDSGEGPAPEVLAGERDALGISHYGRIRIALGLSKLSRDFYKNDRSMRESGFDPSERFGPFNSQVLRLAPVCLNTLLYRMELDLARVHDELGDGGAARWRARASARAGRINALLWDERDGLYYDYDFVAGERRRYPFVTTFYPLWAGLADKTQAARVRENLKRFERPGGLRTSEKKTGMQWDAPYGWAPMQLIAVEGLRRYGYGADADRVSVNWLSLVMQEFEKHHAIVEKYDVETRTSSLAAGLKFGYTSNEIGFGWTNAAFEELYAQLSPDAQRSLEKK